MLGLQAKDRCPNVAEELWVTVQTASYFCHFSHFLEVASLHFLLTQLILFPSWVSEGVEDQIAIVTVAIHRKQVKLCIRLRTHQDSIDMIFFFDFCQIQMDQTLLICLLTLCILYSHCTYCIQFSYISYSLFYFFRQKWERQ